MNVKEFEIIKNKVSDLLSVSFPYEFEILKSDEIYISLKNEKAVISGYEKTDFYYALMQFALKVKEGKKEFEIREKRHFEKLGFFLDLARNGVIKVENIKRIIDCMALLGFNVLKLYMEDVFDLPGYPCFGYRRGKYSKEELKEIDDYAHSMGIEAIPSIQTLGHLEQYLRYTETSEFRENDAVLLCGEEKTYEFIEAMVRRMRECFRTNRLVINCDEAGGVGISKILKEKKYTSPYDTVTNHLAKVMDICKKYEFRPCVNGDLFYGYLGKGYYDFEFNPSKEEVEKIPDVDIIYWDYYHTEYNDYKTLLDGHRLLGKHVAFLGGIWVWAGQLPNVKFTFDTMIPALKCCIDNNVSDVWAATFGDNGNETNIAFAIPSLIMFSQYCFKGNECTFDNIKSLSKKLFSLDMDKFTSISSYHYPWIETLPKEEYIFPNYMGKKIFYADILYNTSGTYDLEDVLYEHKNAYSNIKNAGKGTKWEKYFDYARRIFEITICKTEVIMEIRKAYEIKDFNRLSDICENLIPYLIKKYENLIKLHEEQWMETYKPFGWEELEIRYAGVVSRLKYAKRTITKYLNKEIQNIPELEFEFIDNKYGRFVSGGASYKNLVTTGL